MDQYFHICLRSGPRWLTPPSLPTPPYGQPDRKKTVIFFDDIPKDVRGGQQGDCEEYIEQLAYISQSSKDYRGFQCCYFSAFIYRLTPMHHLVTPGGNSYRTLIIFREENRLKDGSSRGPPVLPGVQACPEKGEHPEVSKSFHFK